MTSGGQGAAPWITAPQRADVVAGADLLGQRQQPPELRRHHVAVGHPVPLDQGEQVLRIEPVHQHDRVAELMEIVAKFSTAVW